MASPQDDNEWDKSTSEIQSEDSDDLFATRPNRWRGPPQSWRALTEEDRLTFRAIERLRNQDLSVHLYNAFALKHPPPAQQQQQVQFVLQQQQQEREPAKPWAPPKGWTAWPLPAHLVPPDDFMKRTEDEDEVFTFRRAVPETPSMVLDEVVSAAVLRCAADKFRRRQELDDAQGLVEDEGRLTREPESSGNEWRTSEAESEFGSKREGNEVGSAEHRTYQPIIATDDDVSYALIRPSTRAILSNLDQTLTILHNARANSVQRATASVASSTGDDAEDDLYNESAPNERRHRSRSRTTRSPLSSRPASRGISVASSKARSLSRDSGGSASPSASKPKSNRGRKPSFLPHEGESERDFFRRRAVALKKKRPVFSDDGDEGTASRSRSASSRRTRTRRRQQDPDEATEFSKQKRLARFHLRDWSDVMGAAALAGFDARVIERATQRCANLFGQGMEMHTIDEETGVETKRYVPGQVVLSSESEDTEEDGERQRRASSLRRSRTTSLAAMDGDDSKGERERRDSPQKRAKRIHVVGSALQVYYCHYADCERAIRSFDKPFNLRRHLREVHGEDDGPRPSTPKLGPSYYYCTYDGCERAAKAFNRERNLRRHLEHVHGEADRWKTKTQTPPVVQNTVKKPGRKQFPCPHTGCERATRPFDRRPNLARHLELVHGREGSKVAWPCPQERDDEKTAPQPLAESAGPTEGSDESGPGYESSTGSDGGSQSE